MFEDQQIDVCRCETFILYTGSELLPNNAETNDRTMQFTNLINTNNYV